MYILEYEIYQDLIKTGHLKKVSCLKPSNPSELQQSSEIWIESAIKGELHCGHSYSVSPIGGQYLVIRNMTSSGATCIYGDMIGYNEHSIPCDRSTIRNCSWSTGGECREEQIEDSLFDKLICPSTMAICVSRIGIILFG